MRGPGPLWGPWLPERLWGTVREDYSAEGVPERGFPHDHARSRVYRWGEDGLLGLTDREGLLAFSVALWNGRDPILKERCFGRTRREEVCGVTGASPDGAWHRAEMVVPHAAYPYALVDEGRSLAETGVLDGERVFLVAREAALLAPTDLAVRLVVENVGPEPATLHLLPTFTFRNTWSWGRAGGPYGGPRPWLAREGRSALRAGHPRLGTWRIDLGPDPAGRPPALLFTENETHAGRLYGAADRSPHVRDAFHAAVVHGWTGGLRTSGFGTRAAAWYRLALAPGEAHAVRLRITDERAAGPDPLGEGFDRRLEEARERAEPFRPWIRLLGHRRVYHYDVDEWLDGDPALPPPPGARHRGRNAGWRGHAVRGVVLHREPWTAPWPDAVDQAFGAAALALVDPEAAREELLALPLVGGRLPAGEDDLAAPRPALLAWAARRVQEAAPSPSFARRILPVLRALDPGPDPGWAAFHAGHALALAGAAGDEAGVREFRDRPRSEEAPAGSTPGLLYLQWERTRRPDLAAALERACRTERTAEAAGVERLLAVRRTS